MAMDHMNPERQNIVFFDGDCLFCNRSVQWIIRRDRAGHFRFAPLQSETARILLQSRVDLKQLDSLVLLEKGRPYTESTAVLKIAKKLDGPWKLAAALLLVPAPLRNAVYRFIARRRHRWFGRQDRCTLPSPEQRERFLPDSVANSIADGIDGA